jgi:hypothetical protein
MPLFTNTNPIVLWQEVVRQAQGRCEIKLSEDLEYYLISLLTRYMDRPEVAQQVFATSFLEAMQQQQRQRLESLRDVGDQCLLFTGLFPQAAKRKQVKLSYFVDLGRSAYSNISASAHDLYWLLAYQFVAMMDVLQSIKKESDLLPLDAYDQWDELGSKHAWQFLQTYSKGLPLKKL